MERALSFLATAALVAAVTGHVRSATFNQMAPACPRRGLFFTSRGQLIPENEQNWPHPSEVGRACLFYHRPVSPSIGDRECRASAQHRGNVCSTNKTKVRDAWLAILLWDWRWL